MSRCPAEFVVIAPVTLFRVPFVSLPTETGTVAETETETGPAPSILWPSLNARPGALLFFAFFASENSFSLAFEFYWFFPVGCLEAWCSSTPDRRLNCSVSCLAFHYLLLHLRTPSKWVHLSYRIGIIFNALPLFCCLYKFVGYNEVKA